MGLPRVEKEQYRRKRAHFNRTAAASRRHRMNVSRIAATEDGKMPYISAATTRLRQPREDRVRRPTGKNFAGPRIALGLLFSLGLFASAAGQGSEPQKTATFAGGCFWCVEADFDKVEGVISTTSGYTGGRTANPSYEEVSRGGTGHAEAVEIVYDPAKVSYDKLLDVFWHNIDPLAKDRQFCDHGDQYRSAIFYHGDEQRTLAEASKAAVQKRFKQPIQTAVVPAGPFYKAEEYHQDYYVKNPVRYKFYRFNCGRDARLEELWGKKDWDHGGSSSLADGCGGAGADRGASVAVEQRCGGRRQLRNPEERQRMARHPHQGAIRRVAAAPYRIRRLESAQRREAQGHVCLRGLRSSAVLLGDQIRQQDRLAELLSAATERDRHRHRLPVAAATHGSALPALRRASGPCLRGRTAAHGIALLHQRRRPEIPARRSGLTAAFGSDARANPPPSQRVRDDSPDGLAHGGARRLRRWRAARARRRCLSDFDHLQPAGGRLRRRHQRRRAAPPWRLDWGPSMGWTGR